MPYPHSFIRLSPEEEKRISDEISLCRSRGKYRRCKRFQAIWLSDSGLTYHQIARRLDVTYRSVKSWCSSYRKKGIEKLLKGGK